MELRETMVMLIHLSTYNFITSEQQQALQTAISHLETLQKVKEMGGVKKKEEWETCTACGGMGFVPNLPNRESYVCGRCNGNKKIERIDYRIFNEALAIKEAELAWKLEGLEEAMNFVFIDYALNGQGNRNLTKSLTSTIQELLLGKKEG